MKKHRLSKIEWLCIVKAALREHKCNKFTIYINEEETAVMLRGFRPDGEPLERVLHRIKLRKSDGRGLAATYRRRERLRRWLAQYEHWSEWDEIQMRKGGNS